MDRFLTSNETFFRLARTILQGILGVVVANLDYIVGYGHFSSGTRAIIVALVMAILSPIMSEIGKHIETSDEFDDVDEVIALDFEDGDMEEGDDDE